MSKQWILYTQFKNMDERLQWFCEPEKWWIDHENEQLILETDEKTDFWQKTHYGFQADHGHFLYIETDKNFRMTTRVKAHPKTIYDQAGLMLRFSEDIWVKTSIEYIPGTYSKLGAVVTNNGYSDWSTQHVEFKGEPVYYRLSRIGQNAYVDFSWDGENWMQIRIAHLDIPEQATLLAGVYACSPQGKGQEVRFDFLTIEELSDDPNEAYL